MEPFVVGLLAGLAASPHCLGMCGGFALHLAQGASPRAGLARQFAFLLGKAFTYAFLGALVGACGLWIVQSGWMPGARQVLPYAAAGVTILLGLTMLELPLRPKLPAVRWPGASLVEEHCARMLPARSLLGSFVFGLAVGFLPCPATTLLLVRAAGEHSVLAGVALLGGVGLGTMPGLLAAGLVGGAVQAKWRSVGTKALGALIILLGLLLLFRRLGLIPGGHIGSCH